MDNADLIALTLAMRASKFSNVNDWAPSDHAVSGRGCTSMMSQSAPAATEAQANGVTKSHLPVPWLGSETIGK